MEAGGDIDSRLGRIEYEDVGKRCLETLASQVYYSTTVVSQGRSSGGFSDDYTVGFGISQIHVLQLQSTITGGATSTVSLLTCG